MINTNTHNELMTGIEYLFPGQIKVYRVHSLKNNFTNPSSSLLHRHFRQPLTEAEQQALVTEISSYLANREPGETYSFFYRSINKDGGYEWHITTTRLNRNNKGQPEEAVLFAYDLELLGELKKRLYCVLENDIFFKENFPKIAGLTKREKEIAALLAKGMSSQEIAATRYISIHTVNTHRKRINEKLAIQNLAGLLKYADVFDLSGTEIEK